MPETSGINAGNGIKSIGSERQKSSAYEYIPSDAKQKVSKLRVGELVKGTIINVPQKNIAIVRLPVGTLTAEIQGQLKPGDSLLLKVEKIKPNLVFKIHSVSSIIEGKELSITEILRILDLPLSKEFYDIVRLIKQFKSNIIRQEVIQIHNFLKQIDSSFINQFELSSIVQTLIFFHKINLPYSENILSRFLPLFVKSNNLDKKIESILSFNADDSNVNHLISQIRNLLNPEKLQENLLNINLIKTQNTTLYQLLIQLKNYTLNQSIYQSLVNDINYLIYYLEGQFLNNYLANRININSYILIPLLLRNKLKLFKASYKTSKSSKKKSMKFTIFIENEEIRILESTGNLNNNTVEINLKTYEQEIAEIIQNSLDELKRLLTGNNFIVNSITVSSIDDNVIESLNSSEDKSSNFSVVI